MPDTPGLTTDGLLEFLRVFPDAVFIWRVNDAEDVGSCTITFANNASSNLVGDKAEAIIGTRVQDSFPDIINTILPIVYKGALRTGKPKRIISLHIGETSFPEDYYRAELVPFSEGAYVAAFFSSISPQIDLQSRIRKHLVELERLNSFLVGREEKMMELKEQVRSMQKQLDA